MPKNSVRTFPWKKNPLEIFFFSLSEIFFIDLPSSTVLSVRCGMPAPVLQILFFLPWQSFFFVLVSSLLLYPAKLGTRNACKFFSPSTSFLCARVANSQPEACAKVPSKTRRLLHSVPPKFLHMRSSKFRIPKLKLKLNSKCRTEFLTPQLATLLEVRTCCETPRWEEACEIHGGWGGGGGGGGPPPL